MLLLLFTTLRCCYHPCFRPLACTICLALYLKLLSVVMGRSPCPVCRLLLNNWSLPPVVHLVRCSACSRIPLPTSSLFVLKHDHGDDPVSKRKLFYKFLKEHDSRIRKPPLQPLIDCSFTKSKVTAYVQCFEVSINHFSDWCKMIDGMAPVTMYSQLVQPLSLALPLTSLSIITRAHSSPFVPGNILSTPGFRRWILSPANGLTLSCTMK